MTDYINSNKDKYIDFWYNLCAIESGSYDKDGVNKAVDLIEQFACSLGFETERIPFEKAGDYIIIDANKGNEKGHVYIAHSDTVFEKGVFGKDVVKIQDGKMYGPGVIDCKGGIAVALLSMKDLCENGYTNHLRLIVTSDEEVDNCLTGSVGVDLIYRMSKGFKSGFCCEVGAENEIVVSRKGIVRMRVDVYGKSAHSGINYFDGINAIEEASHKIIDIQKMSQKGGATFSCNIVTGGSVLNIVPDVCSFSIDIRFNKVAEKESAVKRVVEIVNNDYIGGTKSEITIISERLPMERSDDGDELFEKVKQVAQMLGTEKMTAVESGGGADCAYSFKAGVPTVCGIGTTGEFCHTVNEYANIDSLERRALLISETIKKDM